MTNNLDGSAQIGWQEGWQALTGFLIKGMKAVVLPCLCFFAGRAKRRLCVGRNVASLGIFKS